MAAFVVIITQRWQFVLTNSAGCNRPVTCFCLLLLILDVFVMAVEKLQASEQVVQLRCFCCFWNIDITSFVFGVSEINPQKPKWMDREKGFTPQSQPPTKVAYICPERAAQRVFSLWLKENPNYIWCPVKSDSTSSWMELKIHTYRLHPHNRRQLEKKRDENS